MSFLEQSSSQPAIPDQTAPLPRRRGRPLKGSNEASGKLESRRTRTRLAQRAFRLRKEASSQALERRVAELEGVIEQLSGVFVGLTESLLSNPDQALAGEGISAIARKVVNAAQQFVAVVKIAEGERDEGEQKEERDYWNDGVEDAMDVEAAVNILAQPGALRWEDDSAQNLAQTQAIWMAPATPSLTLSRPPTPPSPLLPPYVPGNGWFGQTPFTSFPHSLPGMLTASTPFDLLSSTYPLGTRLLSSTINTGYHALIPYASLPSKSVRGEGARMFRFALVHHPATTLLFNMRWFLGPGSANLYVLGSALFGSVTPAAATGLRLRTRNFQGDSQGEDGGYGQPPERLGVMQRQILDTMVDEAAVKEAIASVIGGGPGSEGQEGQGEAVFLNAYGVEEYLLAKGAMIIDRDWMVLTASASTPGRDLRQPRHEDGTASSFAADHDSNSSSGNGSVVGGITPSIPPMWQTFNFNGLLRPSSAAASLPRAPLAPHRSGSPFYQRPWDKTEPAKLSAPVPASIVISIPLLIKNLVAISVCLGNGPGYPRRLLGQAVMNSTVERMVGALG